MTKKKHKKMNYDEVKLIIQNLYCEQSMDGTASCYDRIAQEKGIKLDPKILSDSLLKT